jgi:hypothetical protein
MIRLSAIIGIVCIAQISQISAGINRDESTFEKELLPLSGLRFSMRDISVLCESDILRHCGRWISQPDQLKYCVARKSSKLNPFCLDALKASGMLP